MAKQILKSALVFLGFIILILLLLSYLGVIQTPFQLEQDTPAKESFAAASFSPDSKKLYIEHIDSFGNFRIGWIELATSKVVLLVPQDPNDELAAPRPSQDGMTLAIVIRDAKGARETSQIGVLDLERNTYHAITKSDAYKQFPSFSRDGQKIIYGQANRIRESGKTRHSKWDVYDAELGSGIERRLTNFCFFAIENPFYLGSDNEFVFSGDNPTCSYTSQGLTRENEQYYQMYRDNRILLRQIGDASPLRPLFQYGDSTRAAFPTDDGRIFFVAKTNEIDGIKGGNYNFDICVYKDRSITRLTDLKTYLSSLVVAPKGDLLFYSSDKLRNGKSTYWLFDVSNNSHKQIDPGDIRTFEIITITKGEK